MVYGPVGPCLCYLLESTGPRLLLSRREALEFTVGQDAVVSVCL